MKKSTLFYVLDATLVFVAIMLFSFSMFYGLKKSDENRCNELKRQSIEYSRAFWLSPSEKEMCDALGVEIDAPIVYVE